VEHNAVLAGAKAHRDGFLDERVRAEEALDQLQVDAAQTEPSAWDASDGAHPGEAADAAHQPRALPADGDAGKSADQGPVAPAQDAWFRPELRLALWGPAEQDAEAEPYKPDAAQSAEQSCAVQAFAARQQPGERPDAGYSGPPEQPAMRKRQSMALRARTELPQLPAALRDAAMAQLLQGPQAVQPGQRASQAQVPRSQHAQQVRAAAERKPGWAGQTWPRAQLVSRAEPRPLAWPEPAAARDAPVAQPQLPSFE
jgi:hypothetical protein